MNTTPSKAPEAGSAPAPWQAHIPQHNPTASSSQPDAHTQPQAHPDLMHGDSAHVAGHSPTLSHLHSLGGQVNMTPPYAASSSTAIIPSGYSLHHLSSHPMNALAKAATPISPNPSGLVVGLKQEKAHTFFTHYLQVSPSLSESQLLKTTIFTLYRHLMPDEYRYDYANFSNALYDWTYGELNKYPNVHELVEEADRRVDSSLKATKLRRKQDKEKEAANAVSTAVVPVDGSEGLGPDELPRKRTRKKKTADELTKDKFKSMMRLNERVPFVGLRPVSDLEMDDKWTQIQPEHLYSLEQLQEWELSPNGSMSDESRKRRLSSGYDKGRGIQFCVKEDETQYIVFANVPCFSQGSLAVWATNKEVCIEGTVSIPSVFNVGGKQLALDSLQDVDVWEGVVGGARGSPLAIGNFRQMIELPKPIVASCTVGHEGGLVIVSVDKQVFAINKTIL
eukprot:TRINITY_DN2975_c0_g1_i2.p1 TRINITY_DN2975_c0_g1~~TRINITY_DN2975_c0_g1_i2.p1  ORF type:complete len:450 (+),score=130.78 TRINITY_DN2975_c0_g1_i2:60-1409(+)